MMRRHRRALLAIPGAPARCAATAALLLVAGALTMSTAASRAAIEAPPAASIGDESIRTTDPAIAFANLQSQITVLEAQAARGPLTVPQGANLAELLAARGQYTGSIADRERAADIAEQLAAEHPADPIALLARAHGRAAFHRFSEALADLDAAAAHGASRSATDGARAGIDQALGRYDQALPIRRRSVERHRSMDSLAALASLQGERGEVEAAADLFQQALADYRDVSPLPLAWLLFDEGAMRMRQGDLQRARDLFAAAYRRLPWFAPAQCHLAEMEAALGRPERAIALLRPLAAGADDPDAAGQLARILAANGQPEEAARWRAAAAARYDELLARHPDAYADHAAEFWLYAGGDPRRALTLARHNLELRQTARAYELVLAAASASRNAAATCGTYRDADRAPGRSPILAELIAHAAADCAAGERLTAAARQTSGRYRLDRAQWHRQGG